MKRIGTTETYDPAFVPDWERRLKEVNIIITKQLTDELIEKLIDYKDRCILHLTCTGLGGSVWEPGAKDLYWSHNQFNKLITLGFPIDQCVLRIDPIIPINAEMFKRLSEVLDNFLGPNNGIDNPNQWHLRCRISVIDQYMHIKSKLPIKLPWDTFHAPQYVVDKTAEFLSKWKDYYQFEACAEEGFTQDWIDHCGCASTKDIELLGHNPNEFDLTLNSSRYGCTCIKKVNILGVTPKRCDHKCTYCYWKN